MVEWTTDGPGRPTELPRRAWWGVLRRTVREFQQDNMTDWAAALTYYSVLSLFPAMLVLTALVGLAGTSATEPLVENVEQLVPGQSREVLVDAIRELERSGGVAGPLAIVGLLRAGHDPAVRVGAPVRRGVARTAGPGFGPRLRRAQSWREDGGRGRAGGGAGVRHRLHRRRP